ncbi:MAG: hypothetical protein ACFB6S_14965 [Geminicoccaceae bacterium]
MASRWQRFTLLSGADAPRGPAASLARFADCVADNTRELETALVSALDPAFPALQQVAPLLRDHWVSLAAPEPGADHQTRLEHLARLDLGACGRQGGWPVRAYGAIADRLTQLAVMTFRDDRELSTVLATVQSRLFDEIDFLLEQAATDRLTADEAKDAAPSSGQEVGGGGAPGLVQDLLKRIRDVEEDLKRIDDLCAEARVLRARFRRLADKLTSKTAVGETVADDTATRRSEKDLVSLCHELSETAALVADRCRHERRSLEDRRQAFRHLAIEVRALTADLHRLLADRSSPLLGSTDDGFIQERQALDKRRPAA